jgi:hypothetical protein
MQHLSPERIAALVDEPALQEERQHFEQCALCRADFVAVRRIVSAAAAERDRPVAPLVPWQQLSAVLRDEGMLAAAPRSALTLHSGSGMRTTADMATPEVRARGSLLPRIRGVRGLRIATWTAAAAALLMVGVAGGRVSARAPLVPELTATLPTQAAAPMTPVALPTQYRTPADARATLHSAEEVYGNALLWLAEHDSALAPRQDAGSAAAALNYRQRLEVLDAAMATARRALYEAPDDPVMNRYYLATLGAREVTLHRLTTVLPASQQVLEY